MNFAGDKNITVTATTDEETKENSINVALSDNLDVVNVKASGDVVTTDEKGDVKYSLNEIGENTQAITGFDTGKGYITTVTGSLVVDELRNKNGEFRVDEKGNVRAGDVVISAVGDIRGLKNTKWDPDNVVENRAATEGQLKDVSDTVNAGWIATDKNGNQVNITPDNNKLNFAGDENVTVTAANNEIKVALNDDIALGEYLNNGAGVLIGGSSGTISATNSITVGEDQGLIIDGQKKEIQGLSNTTWNEKIANDAAVEGSTAASTAATQGQLQEVSKVANAGWNASDGTNSISIKPNETLGFVGDENLTVSADGTDKKIKVSLNDNITLGEGANQIQLNGDPEANDPALSVGNKFVVEQDGSLTAQTENSKIALGETQASIKVGDNFVDVNNTNVSIEGNQTRVDIGENGAEFRYGNEDVWGYTEIKGGQILTDKVVANDSMIIGDVSTGNYINIDGTTNTITGLSNTTWDDELAKQVANSEELQGTAATQGQLQQAVNEVAEVANAGWNAKAGGNTINVKPNETLNFEGDGNITVSATSGTSSELKFGLNHNITLDNVENANTMLVLNTDGKNADGISGYIPKNYKDDEGHINDFIEEHGGFAIYYANPSLTTDDMTGTFGVTTDGVVHAKDVISYYSASSGSQSDVIRYSLNDVGDIVTQISHAVFDEGEGKTGMEYTLISDFEDEADKDSPFEANEGKTRTIGLAVRQDGAVIVGAVVNDEGISGDYGIRINAETDADGNNKATITGLENTEWKPPTPVATLAANDGSTTVTSRAATEAQLDDLYNTVAAYNTYMDANGSVGINYNAMTLRGDAYNTTTHSGGTIINNVGYAKENPDGTIDGSQAVNVDYLNDAISDAVEKGGVVSETEKHLATNSGTKPDGNATYAPDADGNITISEVNGDGTATGNSVVISDVASKEQVDKNTSNIGNMDFSGTTHIDKDTNNLTDAIKDLDSAISDIQGDVVQQVENSKVTGGHVTEDGKVVLEKGEGNNKSNVETDIQLTDSGVVQEGTTFDKETGTLTITSQDKYSGETSSVTVEGIASTEVVGATTKEDLATAYKDADKDGNATTEYITDSESMVEADVALDHAIQDVANTGYANDMVLSNRIDSVEKRLGNVEERIDKVGAMAAAIANLRTMGFDPEAPTEIAIGVGQYKSETGIAIGVFHYPNQDFMLSASLSSSGDELMGGIGATWKLGRKSAAERAKDEEARHLEQAEEMKKLAQQEKVKAQAQRHAKLLAERQQASQKNA